MSLPRLFSHRCVSVTAVGVCLIALLTAIFSASFAPREHVPLFLALLFFSTIALGMMFRCYGSQFDQLPIRQWILLLVLGAIVLRAAALVAPVSLSDDIYRYVWDGHMVASGENPYVHRPSTLNREVAPYSELYEYLNSPHYYSLYPPLSQLTFAMGARISTLTPISAELALRLLFILSDLLTVFLLTGLLIVLRKPVSLAALYAWNPFVYWEVSAGAHTEALLLPLLVVMLYMTLSKRPLGLGIAIGLAALAKLTILVITPVLGWYILRTRSFFDALKAALTACAVIALGYLPFWHPALLESHRESFSLYAGQFSFNAPIYYMTRYVLGYREGITEPVNDVLLPLLTTLTVLIIIALMLWQNGSTHRLLRAATYSSGAYLLLSTVFHPWYLLPVLLCAVLAQSYAFIVLSVLVPLTYIFYHPPVQSESVVVMGLQFLPFSLLLAHEMISPAVDHILKLRGQRKFRTFQPFIQASDRLLDIGAGEGYVSLAAAQHGHEVMLTDITPSNRTQLPWQTYDGRHLPWSDDTFDVGVLSYVLHHCSDPDQVLKEAARVCKRLVVLESTYERTWEKHLLTFMDHNANRLRGMAPEPLALDTPDGWKVRFTTLGLTLKHFAWLGKLGHKHVIFVLECPSKQAQQACTTIANSIKS